jgi:acetyl esterase/lipase
VSVLARNTLSEPLLAGRRCEGVAILDRDASGMSLWADPKPVFSATTPILQGESVMGRTVLFTGAAMLLLFGGLNGNRQARAEGEPEAAALDPKPRAGAVQEFVYKKVDGKELKIHLHFPAGWKAGDRRPAIVFYHGGGWKAGDPKQFQKQADYLSSRGMVAARVQYRLGMTPVVCVEDAVSSLRWLRGNARGLGIDPERLAAAGGSAGGHLAAVLATYGGEGKEERPLCRPNLLVLFNPVLDMSFGKGAPPEGWKTISPVHQIRKGLPPTVIFYGTEDRLLEQGKQFLGRSQKAGNTVTLYTAGGKDHGFFNQPPWLDVTLREADLFLTTQGYLEGKPTIREEKEKLRKEG